MTLYILDFTEYPGLRHCKISDDSGEEYYHKILNASFKSALDKGETLTVNLDNTAGYAPSFLDEAFGNLIYDFELKNVKKHLKIISTQEPEWKDMIEEQTFNQWEVRRLNGVTPKKTEEHEEWFRIVEGNPELSKWV